MCIRPKTLIIIAALMLFPSAAGAAQFHGGEQFTLTSSQAIQDNVYVGAGNILLAGSVDGDAYLAGGTITHTGTVSEDMVVAGGSISLLGDIGEDLRVAGGTITVEGAVHGEVVATGGLITILPDAVIEGDLIVSGGKLLIRGAVRGDVRIYGGEVIMAGSVAGDVEGEMQDLLVMDDAMIFGNLTYSAPGGATIDEGAVIRGDISFTAIDELRRDAPDFSVLGLGKVFMWFVFLKYLVYLVTAVVLALWLKKQSLELAKHVSSHFGMEFVRGLLIMIAAPLALVLLFASIIGSVFGIIATGMLVAMAGLALPFSGIVFGAWVRQVAGKSSSVVADWKSAVLGVTLLAAAALVPFIGTLFVIIVFLGTFGALSHLVYRKAILYK